MLSILGLSKNDLYYKSFEEFVLKNAEIQSLNIEVQRYKFNKQEENRLKLIEEVKKLRKELKSKKSKNLKKSNSASYILTQGNKILNNEKMRYQFFENQQIGLMLNIIDREYKREEIEKKLELQNKLAIERDLEIKKLRAKEKIEHDERDKMQALKMEKRAQQIKKEMIRKAKEREEEDKKLMIKNELRKQAEERERKERQQEIKNKEEIFKKRIEYLYTLRLKRQQKIEKQFLLKEEIQKKNLEELKIKKDKEIKERIRTTERRMQRALKIIKIKNKERDLKNQKYYAEKSEIIEKQLSLQKEQAKNLMRERLIQSAIKREEVEENLKRKEELLKRNRLRLIYEINEKDKKINLAKSQRLKIWEEQKKLSKNFEENRERLISKFKEIMGKRRKKSKEQVISELLNNKTSEERIMSAKKINLNHIKERNSKSNLDTQKQNTNNKDNNIFLTNLSMRQNDNNRYEIKNS